MDEPIPIEGIVEGDPAALGAVCAAGGTAVLAYCVAAGVRTHVAETVVAALADFRRAVVANAEQEPEGLQELLLEVTDEAVRNVAGITPTAARQATARVALEGAVPARLVPGLARRIISALVQAAPVTAYGGDPAAVRRAAEQHYARLFALKPAPATAVGAAGAAAADAADWVPLEIVGAGAGGEAVGGGSDPASAATWREVADATVAEGPAPGLAAREGAEAGIVAAPEPGPSPSPSPGPSPSPEPSPSPAPSPSRAPAPAPEFVAEHAPLPPPSAPTVPPPPGALVIKRGGHWPSGGRPRLPSRGPRPAGGTAPGVRAAPLLVAGLLGLAAGVGGAILATPEKTVERNAVIVRPLDVPFTVNGAVFNIARTRDAPWALEIRERPLRPNRTWLTLAAQTRNVSRASFHPRALGFRLRTATGIVIGPDAAQVPPDVSAAQGRLPVGKRSSVHLSFQIPRQAGELTLEFDPGPGAPRVRIPLN